MGKIAENKEIKHMIINEILRTFNRTQSIRTTAKEVGCSWQRVVKVLSSNSVIINETHEVILKMHKEGKTKTEIAKETGHSEKTVNAYLPAVRPYYNVSPSDNAIRIKKCRNKKINNQ